MLDYYQCIRCGGGRLVAAQGLVCSSCEARAPDVGGVRVFLESPDAALRAYLDDVADSLAYYERTVAKLSAVATRLEPAALAARARSLIAAITDDTAMMRTACQPITEHVQSASGDDSFIAWLSVQTGLSFHDMFTYFYQDWTPTPQFERARALIEASIAEHCEDRTSVAVLGAGACGLAHALAARFRHAFAVDLSLPPLLLARQFLQGHPLAIHLEDAHWAQVKLTPPPTRTNLEFVAANAVDLPFKSGSMSAVVTQCMFNVAGNPLQLAEEIRRVLRSDGIWLNFSDPFSVPGDPSRLGTRRLEELPEFLRGLGFRPCALSRERYSMLDVSALDPDASSIEDTVHRFVLRKTESVHAAHHFGALRKRFRDEDASLWQAVPSPIPERLLSVTRRQTFGTRGVQTEFELGVGGYGMPIPEDYAALLGSVVARADGQATLRAIWQAVRVDFEQLTEPRFLRLMYTLCVERYFLALRCETAQC